VYNNNTPEFQTPGMADPRNVCFVKASGIVVAGFLEVVHRFIKPDQERCSIEQVSTEV